MVPDPVVGDLPDADTLARGLTSVLAGRGNANEPVQIECRTVNPYISSTASELVRCHRRGVGQLELFCKYGPSAPPDNRGHHGGLAYEALVHRHVLRASTEGPPPFHGAFAMSNSTLGLVFGDLPGAVRVNKLPPAQGLCRAAAWIGHFHANHEVDASGGAPIPLLRYDLDYFVGWADRTRRFADRQGSAPRRFNGLCDAFPRVAQHLLEGSLTVVHGEYYPHNVLIRDGEVHPVDWETAAIAAGEIDLAALTERWPRVVAEQCENAYRLARWAGKTPASFHKTMLAARLYLQFRWLGDRPEWTRAERFRPHWAELRSVTRQLDALARSAGG